MRSGMRVSVTVALSRLTKSSRNAGQPVVCQSRIDGNDGGGMNGGRQPVVCQSRGDGNDGCGAIVCVH